MQPAKKVMWPLLAAIAIAGGSYMGTVEFNHNTVRAESTAQTAKPTAEPRTEAANAVNDLSRAFRSVHHAMEDAVVNIHVVDKQVAEDGDGLHEQFHLPEGFKLPPGFDPEDLTPHGRGGGVIEGTGSGVIVSPDGYILTNNHVVENAKDITVTLNDGRDLKAKVIGTDPKTDLAVLRVTADHLTYAKFGDSDATEVGDWVLAFGSPFGFKQTMTQGIISAKGRSIDIIGSHNPAIEGLTYEDFLQTDAAINPGNSGGPLVNMKGEVIGIDSAIASSTGAYNGVGFAIPSNDAHYIMDSLIKNGKIVRGYLGVSIEDVNHPAPRDQALADLSHKAGFSGKGVLVSTVDPEGPAGKGGVGSGDVVTALDGKPVDTINELRNRVARLAPGTEVALSVFHDGKSKDLKFALGTQPEHNAAYAESQNEGVMATAANHDLGISVKSVDSSIAKKYHLGGEKGVIVTDVAADSLAANLGINPGDVITRVGKTAVNTPKEFSEVMAKEKLSDGVRLTVRTSDGMERTVYIEKK